MYFIVANMFWDFSTSVSDIIGLKNKNIFSFAPDCISSGPINVIGWISKSQVNYYSNKLSNNKGSYNVIQREKKKTLACNLSKELILCNNNII